MAVSICRSALIFSSRVNGDGVFVMQVNCSPVVMMPAGDEGKVEFSRVVRGCSLICSQEWLPRRQHARPCGR
jgi:hypothetical protein